MNLPDILYKCQMILYIDNDLLYKCHMILYIDNEFTCFTSYMSHDIVYR